MQEGSFPTRLTRRGLPRLLHLVHPQGRRGVAGEPVHEVEAGRGAGEGGGQAEGEGAGLVVRLVGGDAGGGGVRAAGLGGGGVGRRGGREAGARGVLPRAAL